MDNTFDVLDHDRNGRLKAWNYIEMNLLLYAFLAHLVCGCGCYRQMMSCLPSRDTQLDPGN